MDIAVIGVGEAFDETLPNCSVLATAHTAQGTRSILLDCGFSAPFAYWRTLVKGPDLPDPLDLDAVWISHFHGDHFFGLPALLLRLHEEGRTRPLAVVGQEGVEKTILAAMDLAYPGTRLKFPYPLEFREIEPGRPQDFLGLRWHAAPSEHPRLNYSLRLSSGSGALFYSGDGRPTPETQALAKGAGLIVHESYSLDPDTPGHGTVPGAIDFARRAGAGTLALVHLRRDVRAKRREEIQALMAQAGDLEVLLPEPGARLRVPRVP